MILTVIQKTTPNLEELANKWIGKTVFVCWPHLLEAMIIGVSNDKTKIIMTNLPQKVMTSQSITLNKNKLDDKMVSLWNTQRKSITET